MRLLVFILLMQYVASETDLNSTESMHEVKLLNGLNYEHYSRVLGLTANFNFKINNLDYARKKLNITSYYISITFIDKHHQEERTEAEDFPKNESKYHGILKMKHLENEENYLVCVFFLKDYGTNLLGSSRFCHVISVSGSCDLESIKVSFTNQPVYLLLILVVVILGLVVLVSRIRDCIYRPRTIDAILRALPEHHAQDLEGLASVANRRRQRGAKRIPNLNGRNSSVSTVEYDPNADHEFFNYHGYDTASLGNAIDE